MQLELDCVQSFHEKINAPTVDFPTDHADDKELHSLVSQAEALADELETLRKSRPNDIRITRIELMYSEVVETCRGLMDGDRVETADGLADSLYVILGTALTYNMPLRELFACVHSSNMTKVKSKDEEGFRCKEKGEAYKPPNIQGVLDVWDQLNREDLDNGRQKMCSRRQAVTSALASGQPLNQWFKDKDENKENLS